MANLKASNVDGSLSTGAYRGNANVGGTGTASWHPDGAYIGGTLWQYGAQYKNNTGIYDVSTIQMYSGPYQEVYNTRNLILRGRDSSDIGLEGRGSDGTNRFQLYGEGSNYGFLNGTWAAWDLRKVKNGNLYMNDNNTYYLNTSSSSYLYQLSVNQNLYLDNNYGSSIVGLYDSYRYQGVFAMGNSYKLALDGTSPGSLYGLAWTHTNVGGQSKAGLGHQLLVMMNGTTYTALGSGIWTDGTITTTSHGTSANWNTAYGWGNHASAGYQAASTAITTSNIASQSVSYAVTAGSANTASSATTATSASTVGWGGVSGKPNSISGYGITDGVTTAYNSSLNSDSRNSRGVTRLYRRDDDSDYSVQAYWTGSHWFIRGYGGDSFHAEARVGYADAAGSANTASSASSASTSSQVTINYNNDSNSTYQMLWGSGNSVYGTGGIYCNPNSDIIYASAFYDSNDSGYYLNPNGYSNLYTARAYEWQLHAGAGYGVNFWGGSSSYGIQMSEAGNGTWGGRVAGETTSDYNMYFTMSGGTNRGFVFRNGVSSGSVVAGIDAGGNFRAIGDAIVYASSDARLKKNVKPIENALDKVMQINGVEFDWDEAAQQVHKGHDVGVIAQEIEAVLPEIVQTRDNGYKAVKYEKLVALLIESVKELQAEIEDLKAQIK